MIASLRNHSHYSLLLSTSKPNQIVSKCSEAGYTHVGLTDTVTVGGCVNFIKACKEKDIKPIIGSEIKLEGGGSITLICKNNKAWRELLVLISLCNDPENYTTQPQVKYEELIKNINPDNFIVIDGYAGSRLFYELFYTPNQASASSDIDQVRSLLNPDWLEIGKLYLEDISKTFKSYFLEINNEQFDSIPSINLMSDCVKELDVNKSFIIFDTCSYYKDKTDSIDHRVLLCVKLKTTLKKLELKINEGDHHDLVKFIRSGQFNIKTVDELKELYSECSLAFDNMRSLISQCDDLTILSSPRLPKFECPAGMNESDYLKQLCRDGWAKLLSGKLNKEDIQVYKDRVLKELGVIDKADLAGYFLIVQDYVNNFKKKGCLIGPARGSGGGSLVCFLTGITMVDPIKYGLIFERFYNEGRNTVDHVSLPDIDVDFPPDFREAVITYLKEKYGGDKVCQMLTFGRLAGRSIVKEVLRVNEACSFEEMNEITKKIPNQADISDLLEEMESPSVIRWALEYNSESLQDYCYLDNNGKLAGYYAKIFEQAMRMEGIFKTQGKHAAGVVIASDPLDEVCPMVKASMAGMEMGDLEAIGCVKFDILGVGTLKRIHETVEEINNEFSEIFPD
jgi:DNA polymerase-3 subunit alpha